MGNPLKAVARRSKTAIILFKIVDNWRLKRRTQSGSIETIHGSTHSHIPVADSLTYIDRQFSDYLAYAGLSESNVVHKKILELGPGDNLGVALKFVAAGADSVTCLDRFYSKRDTKHEKEIYEALRERLNNEQQQQRFDEAISLANECQFTPGRVTSIYGDTIEQYAERSESKFDLIISCAVLEEIYDLDPTFAAMDSLLAPGGMLIHKIDLSDYGMFRKQGMHPLTFLTIPESIYRRMASDSGLPNRKRLSYYINKMAELGYDARVFATSVIPEGRFEPAVNVEGESLVTDAGRALLPGVRGKLDAAFKALDETELLIDGILLVAKKHI